MLAARQAWRRRERKSVVLACVMAWRSRDGLGRYALPAVAASAVVLAARLGTRTRWAAEMLREYVP